MDDISIDINIGSVSSLCGKINFTLVIKPDRKGILQLHVFDPTDMRKSGVLVQLDANRYSELKQIIDRIDVTIERMENLKQMDGLGISKY